MGDRLKGKVAFITGAGRGQGRAHAIRLAQEGADIIAIDACTNFDTVRYDMASEEDLQETVRLVEALDRRILASKVDVRDAAGLAKAVNDGVAEFGKLDIIVANAAICSWQKWDDTSAQVWQDTLDVNLTGVWNTIVAGIPHLIANGGGSIIATSSTSGIKGTPWLGPYVAAKHGVVGIIRMFANELARHNIRANTVHPTGVNTPLATNGFEILNQFIAEDPKMGPIFTNPMPIDLLEPVEISNAVLFLASDEARYVTGTQLKVDAGNTNI
ncbi:mycofactocin-coupled SDR family oxidoreductase [Subtercola endophyticus]|uniref:mycofactocin-coupled SDR family oxidoreductase n=1 Tax=Subtercola endophyticus TaxID=2895559 RepID=UPI001E41D68D|nr:mycofactocin-coupled SDR family oxidoreductase [Subtercola endophyticus]UFS58120.1 mycofactocin-coupled SDR family oxidoreductase [Subtercola endophyticus]